MTQFSYIETAHCPQCQKSPMKLMSEFRRSDDRAPGLKIAKIGIIPLILGLVLAICKLLGASSISVVDILLWLVAAVGLAFIGVIKIFAKQMTYTEWVCDSCASHYPYSPTTSISKRKMGTGLTIFFWAWAIISILYLLPKLVAVILFGRIGNPLFGLDWSELFFLLIIAVWPIYIIVVDLIVRYRASRTSQ